MTTLVFKLDLVQTLALAAVILVIDFTNALIITAYINLVR